MDIADWYGLALRLVLASAERFKLRAIRRGLLCLKTSGSRSSALLRRVTLPDQRRPLERDFISQPRRQCRKRSEISPLSCFWILFAGVEAVSTRFQFLNHKVMELILPMLPEHHQAIRFPRNST
jgi:hypothetical protein